jgi:hypothetical protein
LELIDLQLRNQYQEFNEALIEAIDETISELLSGSVVNAIYAHLEKVYSITKSEVPNRPELLFSALEKTFGVNGSRTISKAIARKLYAKYGFPFNGNPGRKLPEYVEEAKSTLGERARGLVT